MNALRYLIVFISIAVFTGCLESSRAAPAELAEKYGSKVVLYATSWCGYCEKTRKLFKQYNIQYLEYDIENSIEGKREFDQLGAKGIPLVLINGRVVEGYAPKAVLELLKENKKLSYWK